MAGTNASLILDYGGAEPLEIVGTSDAGSAVFLLEFNPPLVSYDEEYAESADTEGAERTRSRAQDPTATGKVRIRSASGTTFWANVKAIQETIENLRRNGGVVRYAPYDGTVVLYDVVSAYVTGLPQDKGIWQYRAEPEFTLVCKPYGRLSSVTVAANVTSTDPIFSVPFDTTKIPGSVEALGKLVLTDLAAQNRDHVEWGLDPDNVGNFLIDSTSLDVTGLAGVTATRSGAYSGGSNNVIRGTLTSAPLAICDTGSQTNTRRWRVKARVYAAGTGPVYVRLAWRVGGGQRTRNAYAPIATNQIGQFYEVDLGLVEVPTVVQGSQAWSARIEAYTDNPGDTLDIDYLALVPAYRGGKLRAVASTVAPVLSGWDDFRQAAGALTTKVAPLGGTWTNVASDDADDFNVTASKDVTRTATSDAAFVGRLVSLGTTSYAAITAEVDMVASADASPFAPSYFGLFTRLTDINNFLILARTSATIPNGLILMKVVGGALNSLWQLASPWLSMKGALRLRLAVNADGTWAVYFQSPGAAPMLHASGQDADLATGGALASGKVGLYDNHQAATALTRHYDNFSAFAPESPGHVINSGKSCWVLDNTALREPSSGTVWGKVPSYEGAYLRMPPNRAGRVIVKARRLDVDDYPDSNIADNLRADLECTPRVALLG